MELLPSSRGSLTRCHLSADFMVKRKFACLAKILSMILLDRPSPFSPFTAGPSEEFWDTQYKNKSEFVIYKKIFMQTVSMKNFCICNVEIFFPCMECLYQNMVKRVRGPYFLIILLEYVQNLRFLNK